MQTINGIELTPEGILSGIQMLGKMAIDRVCPFGYTLHIEVRGINDEVQFAIHSDGSDAMSSRETLEGLVSEVEHIKRNFVPMGNYELLEADLNYLKRQVNQRDPTEPGIMQRLDDIENTILEIKETK